MPIIGSASPTNGRDRVGRLLAMPMSTGESFM